MCICIYICICRSLCKIVASNERDLCTTLYILGTLETVQQVFRRKVQVIFFFTPVNFLYINTHLSKIYFKFYNKDNKKQASF